MSGEIIQCRLCGANLAVGGLIYEAVQAERQRILDAIDPWPLADEDTRSWLTAIVEADTDE